MGRSAQYVQQQQAGKKLSQNYSPAVIAPFSSHATTYRINKPSTTSPSPSSIEPHSSSALRTSHNAKTIAAAMPPKLDRNADELKQDDRYRSSGSLWSGTSSAFFDFSSAVTTVSSSATTSRSTTPSRRADIFEFSAQPLSGDGRQGVVHRVASSTPHTPSSTRSSPGSTRNTARRPKEMRSHRPATAATASPQSAPATVYEQWQALERQSQRAINQPRSRRALGPLLTTVTSSKRQPARLEEEEEVQEPETAQEQKQGQKQQAVNKRSRLSSPKQVREDEAPLDERIEVEGVNMRHPHAEQLEEDNISLSAKLISNSSKRRAEPQPHTNSIKRRFLDAASPTFNTAASAPRVSRNSIKATVIESLPAAALPATPAPLHTAAAVPEANDDYCAACGHGGNLVMCAACVQAWHFGCMQPSSYSTIDQVPDEWTCALSNKKCTSRPQPKLETDTLSETDMSHFQWTSQPTKRREGGRHYTSFKRGDEQFKLGDFVCICTEEADSSAETTDRIGEIVDAWQDMYGGRLLEVRWYWLPQETKHGRLPAHHDRELFGTAHMGEVEVDTIQSKVSVLSERDYHDRAACGELDDCVYFCRKNYDHDRGDFKPLVSSEGMRAGGVEGRRRGRRAAGVEGECDNDDEWELDGAGGKARKHRRVVDNAASTFSRACTALQLSSLPASLPCREEEASKVRNFLTSALRRGGQHGGGLYIAGVPGTGKTATVRQVLGELARKATKDQDVLDGDRSSVPQFQFIEVNGMKLPDPSHAFTHIWQSLTGQHASPKRAVSLLDARFRAKASRRPVCVLLLDEIDFCLTRSQQLLYALSDWPTHPHSRLVTISISNTIDFPELLHERVRSRFVGEHVTFRPYKSGQVEEIIVRRLDEAGGGGLFEKDAITFAAKKIASINGDIRVALEICRRAAIIAQEQHAQRAKGSRGEKGGTEPGKSECVTMRVVQRAIAELQGSSEQELTRQCTTYQAALLAVIHCSNVVISADAAVAVDFNSVSDRLRRAYLHRSGGLLLMASEVEAMANDLVSVGLLEWVGKGRGDMNGVQVRMKMPPHLCEHALKDNAHWQQIVS